MKDKIESVDGVRGLACLMVILSHLSLIFFPYVFSGRVSEMRSDIEYYIYHSPITFFYSGTSAVFIFFSLSGFILTYACCKNNNILFDSIKMTLSRYPRLMLPTFGSIMLCYIVMVITPSGFNQLNWIGGMLELKQHSFLGALYNGFVSAVLFCDRSYNIIIWTMQVEFFGSLIIFGLTPLISQIKYKVLLLTIVALVFVCLSPSKIGCSYASFLIGSAIYHANIKPNKLLGYFTLLTGIYFAGFHNKSNSYTLINDLLTFNAPGGRSNSYYISNMISGFLIVFSIIKAGVIQSIVTSRISLYLGKVSYSAYLIQIPVFYVITQLAFDFLSKNGLDYISSALITCVISIVSIYAISNLFYEFVDKRSIKVSKLSHKLIE
ncbi:TPA: acyltransferase [Escherichia coli]|nr:acyltransferase [Escherichia coli]EGK4157253.1 acyltransferase [Escherichia coli]NUE52188.1 acyltransferase [Escherichia coli]HBA3886645.1 acyltransferase [Escherichia coli]HBA3927575.1 acyltransferase [Escherichia coli]